MNHIDFINDAAAALAADYCGITYLSPTESELPNRCVLIKTLFDIKRLIFPGYFATEDVTLSEEAFARDLLEDIYKELKPQVEAAFFFESRDKDTAAVRADEVCCRLIAALPKIRRLLICDVDAGFHGDPAAKNRAEIIVSYPGLLAIFVYRIAHILYMEQVPLIPRMMTEYAHSETGIDINAGAVIGEYFFIDHGTGVVIGETTIIGNHVKLYQGVTLGALSTRRGQELSGVKRHPTIGDNVTIYANSSVLGGETVIGSGVIIGGNAFITKSVPDNTRVSVKGPEMLFKNPTGTVGTWEI